MEKVKQYIDRIILRVTIIAPIDAFYTFGKMRIYLPAGKSHEFQLTEHQLPPNILSIDPFMRGGDAA